MRLTLVTLTILGLHAGGAEGASVRDHSLQRVDKSRPGELNPAYLTILGFTIGKTTFEQIRNELGRAAGEKQTENAAREVCYVSSDPQDQTRIVFLTGALGEWETLTGFEVLSQEAWDDSLECFPTARISKSISAGGPLRLGASLSDLKKHLGSPTEQQGGLVRWHYSGRQPMSPQERATAQKNIQRPLLDQEAYFDTVSGVDVSCKDSSITSFAVDRVVSF